MYMSEAPFIKKECVDVDPIVVHAGAAVVHSVRRRRRSGRRTEGAAGGDKGLHQLVARPLIVFGV